VSNTYEGGERETGAPEVKGSLKFFVFQGQSIMTPGKVKKGRCELLYCLSICNKAVPKKLFFGDRDDVNQMQWDFGDLNDVLLA
jgi:hypothetical protein